MLKSTPDLNWLTTDQWQAFVEDHENSSVFHHRHWLELLSAQYGSELIIPALLTNGNVRAAIPLLPMRSLRGRKKLISLPFTDYIPILSNDQDAVELLCQQMRNEFRGHYDEVVIRSNEPVSDMASECSRVQHELQIDGSLSEIEAAFAKSIRRNLSKGRRNELEFHNRDDTAALNIFYKMHVLTRRKLGVPVQPKSFFNRINDKLIKTGLGSICVVSRKDVPLSAGVMLGYNGRFVYKYAASDPSALELRPNDWLVYNTIRIASEEGYRVFDFGISDKHQEGLRRFKSKWGATETDIYYSYILGEPNQVTTPSHAMRVASRVIQRSPTAVCRLLGKAFYKYSQ